MNFKTYLVGGSVRDQLLGIKPKDLDYVVLAPSFDDMRSMLLSQGCKIFVEKPQYLTIRANHPKLGAVDFACARKDGNYSDGRRPDETSIAETLVQDLARRDFTCNAIAQDIETGELVDPFNGQIAIENKLLTAVGNAKDRLSEDRLRAFRALRFAVTKSFIIDWQLQKAITEIQPGEYDSVSTERIREEIHKAFKANTSFAFHLLNNVYPWLWQVIIRRGIWFKPTTEE